MSNVSLATQQTTGLNREQVDLIKRTIAKGATDDELALFVQQCNRTGLDPFARQISLIKRWSQKEGDTMTIQTTIDGYRLIADRSGKYAGNDDPLFDEGLNEYRHIIANRGVPKTATVTVYKLVGGLRCPFTSTVRWEEYCPNNEKQQFMWKRMPYLMLAKCAESLALRKAFPQELSGLYTSDEMAQAGNPTGEVVDSTATIVPDPPGWPEVAGAPSPVAQPGNGHADPTPEQKPAKLKPPTFRTPHWATRATALHQKLFDAGCPKYAKPDGSPDLYHMSMSAAKEGFVEITDANLDAVLAAIERRATAPVTQ